MAEAGTCINFNDTARQFGIHQTTAYRTINRFWQTGLAGDSPKSDRREKLSTRGTFNSYHVEAEGFILTNQLC